MQTEVLNFEDVNQTELFEFLQKISNDESPASKNMWNNNWKDQSETLPYLLYKKKRFTDPKGMYTILKINGEIKAIAGVYISDFDPNIAIGLVRGWVDKEYRGKFVLGNYIAPVQLAWAKEKKCKSFFLTFNEYNKNLVNIIKRNGLGRSKNRNPKKLFFNGVYESPFPVEIQYTKQWVVYDMLDSYTIDWEKIKWMGS